MFWIASIPIIIAIAMQSMAGRVSPPCDQAERAALPWYTASLARGDDVESFSFIFAVWGFA